MRKTILILLCASALISSVYAQQTSYRVGIKAGINYIHLENYGKGLYSDFEANPGYSIGALFEYTRGGFLNYSITPEIVYTESRTNVDLLYITNCMATIQTIDIPLTFKLGLRLSKIFRPYVLANIYGSYMTTYYGKLFDMLDIDHTSSGAPINKLFFGVSTGMGFNLWCLQFEGRYRWNLVRINTDDYTALKQMGLELSCAIYFN